MKWSQLKKRLEATFADSVSGRVEVWNTRYRKSHDAEGEAWITVDKKRVSSMATYTYFVERYREMNRIREELGCVDRKDPEQREGFYEAWRQAEKTMRERGVYPLWIVNKALFDYLNFSIDDIVKSENHIIRAFGMLDRRIGKRRLKSIDDTDEHPLVRTLYRFRCEAEGVKIDVEQRAAWDKPMS